MFKNANSFKSTGLDFITRLYAIEKECYNPDQPPDLHMTELQIKQYRLTYSVPVLKEFYRWLQRYSRDESVLPKSPFGKTVSYTFNEYPFLINYLRNGAYRIDNNAIERMNRAPVIGRKNYLFCGFAESMPVETEPPRYTLSRICVFKNRRSVHCKECKLL